MQEKLVDENLEVIAYGSFLYLISVLKTNIYERRREHIGKDFYIIRGKRILIKITVNEKGEIDYVK